jgi:hypothetical protein
MIKSKFTLWIKKWLCKNVVYYSDKRYNFSLDSQQQFTLVRAKSNAISAPKFIQIVGRKHYSEQSESYPIGSKKELTNLIKINNQSTNNKLKSHSAYIITALAQEQSKVTYWEFNGFLPKAWLNLPESLLLSQTLAPEHVINNTVYTPMFITQHQKSVFSALASPLISSGERFATMFGVPCKTVINITERKHYAQSLINGLQAQPKQQLTAFFNLPKGLIGKSQLKKTALIFSTILGIYIALTSGYLIYQIQSIKNELAQNKASVNQALNTLEQFQISTEKLSALQHFTQNQAISSPLFFILHELLPVAEVTNIRFENNRYVLRGTANKATDALQSIINNSRVQTAKFDYPSHKERNGESFVISFTLNTQQDQALPSQNHATRGAE